MGAGAADIGELVPEIFQRLPAMDPPPALAPEAARFRLFDSITRFLKNASGHQPLFLVLDDLHWADEPSLQLLRFLARELEDSCVMVVGCYRDVELSRQHPLSETLAHLAREAVYQRHLLRGLGRDDTARFIEAAAGTGVSQHVLEAVYAHTEGNPFFTTELVQLLSDRGELAEEAVGGPQGLRIPEGVREVIGQRLNRLSEECNHALTIGAVLGRQFGIDALARLSPGLSEERALELMEEALAARLIEEAAPNVGYYQFTHRLLQEVLVQELSLTRRVRLHARIAGVLEEMYETEIEAHAAELAYHFTQSEAVTGPEKVVEYSIMAGEQALRAYAYEEAEEYFRRALASKEGQPMDAQGAAIRYRLARAVAATRGSLAAPEVLDNLQRAFQYFLDAGDVARAVQVAEYPFDQFTTGTVGTSDFISRALAFVPADSQQEGRLLSRYGTVLYSETGDYQGAQDAFSRALAIARREGDLTLEIQTLAAACQVAWWRLSLPEVVGYAQQAVELSGQVDDPRAEAVARNYLTRARIAMGDAPESRSDRQALLATAQRLRDRQRIVDAFGRNAEFCYFTGDWEAASDLCDRGLALSGFQPLLRSIRATLAYETGDFTEGWSHMERLTGSANRASAELVGFT
jgi:tetratricopeptide (TPR) repeat protein